MRRHVWQFLFIVVLLTSCAAADDVANVRPERGRIELIRDTWGTPHVFAETDAGAMYGLGYAAAEDRAFQMYYSLRIMQGRLAELVGLAMMPGRQTTAVDHDREMRTFGFCRAAREVVRHLDRESLALLQAYSDGVNDCMAATRDKRHYLFDELGLEPEPWTPADCITSWWHLGQFFAGDGTRELIHYRNTVGGGPEPAGRAVRGAPGRGLARSAPRFEARDLVALGPDDAAAVIQREDVTADWLRVTQDFMRRYGPPATRPAGEEGPKFSHAWVVGGSRTTTGSAVLISDPQTPVRNPSLFYEFHIQGKSFNARGIGVPGSPIILIGWNQHVAWGMTALGADQADLFRLKTDSQHPDQYFFDGQWRPMTVLRETIKVRGGRDEPLTIRLSHLGPVATAFCFALPGESEVALKRIPICETERETITGAIAMMRAGNAGQFMSALGGWRFPSVNVVFGDAKGDIGFSIAGAIPIRSPLEPLSGAAAMDGSATRLDWQTIVPPDLLPRVINPKRGYIASANHRAIGLFYPIPLGASTGWLGDTERSWRLCERLEMKPKFSPQDVLDIHHDGVNPARRDIVRIGLHLRDVLKHNLSEGAVSALEHLRPWFAAGASSDLMSSGAELACEIPTFFRITTTDLARIYGGGQSGLCYFLKTVDARLGQNPSADITPLEQAFIDDSLAAAWTSAVQRHGPDPKQWPAIARRQVTQRRLGYFESLDGFASLDPRNDLTIPALTCVDGGTIKSQAAQSYTQFVPLHDVDAALSILPIGASESPDSPSRTSTIRLWATGQLHPAPLSRDKVAALTVSKRMLDSARAENLAPTTLAFKADTEGVNRGQSPQTPAGRADLAKWDKPADYLPSSGPGGTKWDTQYRSFIQTDARAIERGLPTHAQAAADILADAARSTDDLRRHKGWVLYIKHYSQAYRPESATADLKRVYEDLVNMEFVVAPVRSRLPFEGDPRLVIHRDVMYGRTHPQIQKLDAYLVTSSRPTPVLVEIHGGGWRRGSKSQFVYQGDLIEAILGAGISVVSIDYRLTPEHQFPAPMDDVGRAVQFVRSKAKEWNLDPNRIGAMGGSAGAHLAAWLAVHDDLATPESPDMVQRLSSRLTCFVALAGPMDLTRVRPIQLAQQPLRGQDFANAFTAAFGCTAEAYERDPELRRRIRDASPLFLVSRDDPPAFVMAAWGEDLTAMPDPPVPAVINDPHSVWHSVLLAESLRRNGVPVVARLGPQAGKDPAADNAAIVAFLRERLLPPQPKSDSPAQDGPGK